MNWWGKNWYSTTARDISNTFLSCGVPHRYLTSSSLIIQSNLRLAFPGEARVGVGSPRNHYGYWHRSFFFCEIIDLGSTRKNELAQHPIILTCTRSSGRIHVWYPIIPVRALLNMAIRSGYLGISSHRAKSCLCAEKVWKISGRDCGPVRRLDRFLETYPFFYDERCHWDLGLWILTKHGLRSGKHWNLWSLWKRFQERFGMTGFRILCVSRKCNA